MDREREVRENADRLGVNSVLVFQFLSSDGGFGGLNHMFVQIVIACVTYFLLSDVKKPDLMCDNWRRYHGSTALEYLDPLQLQQRENSREIMWC